MAEGAPETARSSLPRRFLFNINFVFVSTLTSNTIGFFVAILLARALGPEGRGETALYQAAVSIGFALLNLGISSAAFYFAVRSEFTGRQAMEAGLNVTLIAAAGTGIAVLVTRLAFSGLLEGRDIPYGLAVVTVPAVIQVRVCEGLLRAQGRFGRLNLLEVAHPISMVAILGGLELAVGLTVPLAVWGLTLAYLPVMALGYALLGPSVWPRSLAPLSLLVKAVRFGGQGQLMTLIQLLNYRLDVFLILIFVNTAGVGLYTVAASQTEGLLILANSVAIVLLTNITAGDTANSLRLTPIVCRNTLLVTGAAAAVAAIIAPLWLTAVFGSDYEASLLPYLILLPGMAALSGAKILAAYVFSRGKPIINAWISLITLIVTIPTDLVLIGLFGVPGAAAGTTFGYVLTLALTAIAYRRLSGGSILEALVPRPSDAGIYIDGLKTVLRRLQRRQAEAPSNP